MYRNALVTTDGSLIADAALVHVPKVVEPDGQVTVIEVVDDIAMVLARSTPAGFEMGGSGLVNAKLVEQIVADQRRQAIEHLGSARALLERAGMRHIATAILEGLPGERIVEQARERGCDVVVMSTHGRGGLRRTVLGSVADHVLRHLDDVPVLLVHPGAA